MRTVSGGFGMKRPKGAKALKRGVTSSLFYGEKFSNLRLVDWHIKKIFGLVHLRNVRIFDSGMLPRICGFVICELNKIFLPTFGNKLWSEVKAFSL